MTIDYLSLSEPLVSFGAPAAAVELYDGRLHVRRAEVHH